MRTDYRLAGVVKGGTSLEHVPFGLVQGEDGKKFATRSGDTVKLADLLRESVRIARVDVAAREGYAGGQELPKELQVRAWGAPRTKAGEGGGWATMIQMYKSFNTPQHHLTLSVGHGGDRGHRCSQVRRSMHE